jgi:predicted heme/steroid binding protein/uncharacterized membrane protein
MMKVYTIDELNSGTGKDNKPTLVVVDGTVYDLSGSKKWICGVHMNRHHAGADLSAEIRSAPHGPEVLTRFSSIGKLHSDPPPKRTGMRGRVESWLTRHPFFRRHPHPAVVHFPVGLLLVIPVLEAFAHLTASPRTEWAAFCCLALGVAAIPPAIVTGYFTWWVNYECAESTVISRKRMLAWASFFLGIGLLFVRLLIIPDPLTANVGVSGAYFTGLLLISAVIGYVGFLGGKLTIPYE